MPRARQRHYGSPGSTKEFVSIVIVVLQAYCYVPLESDDILSSPKWISDKSPNSLKSQFRILDDLSTKFSHARDNQLFLELFVINRYCLILQIIINV